MIREWLKLWFTFERNVGRREYLLSGIALALTKYAGDALIYWIIADRFWHPLNYLHPLSATAAPKFELDPLLLPVLALWALPFLWVGISMSMRRALDAGVSAWLALGFFIPGINYLLIALLASLPTVPVRTILVDKPRVDEPRLPRALLAIASGAALGLGMMALSVFGLRRYGVVLFFGTPFVVGLVTAWQFNRSYRASSGETFQVVMMTLLIVAGVILLTAAEGVVCILMSAPIAIAIGTIGASLGRHLAMDPRDRASHVWVGMLMLPMAAVTEPDKISALREVRSAVVIDATPMEVWQQVIAFPPLPAPNELVFRAGIAYPVRAELIGEGVGAVRYCVFSTGSFVEPITHWEPGRRLAFDVTEQPAPLQEWSPYAGITPPHLDGYFRSRKGEFRLVALAEGRTRLEGSTWYELKLAPEAYWVLFADALISRIHKRVLNHIAASSGNTGGR